MRRIAGSVWAAWSPLCDLSQQSAVRTSPLFVVCTVVILPTERLLAKIETKILLTIDGV